DYIADARRLHAAAALRGGDELAQVELLTAERGGGGLERIVGQRRLTRDDAPIAQRWVAQRDPAVFRTHGDDDRFASEGIPPHAEEMDACHLEPPGDGGVEGAPPRLRRFGRPVSSDAPGLRGERA